MRKGLLGVLGSFLAGTAPLFAQTELPGNAGAKAQPLPTVIAAPSVVIMESGPTVVDSPFRASSVSDASGSRMWGSADYLLWRVKSAPNPLPLVTTGDPVNDLIPGAIGQPGTRVVFGNTNQSFQNFSGGKLTLGAWLDCEQRFGIEAGGFLLEKRTSTFTRISDGAGNPPTYIPFNETDPAFPGPNAATLADPVIGRVGSVSITQSLQLWGTEFNGLFCLYRKPGLEVNGLVGFRYMDLRETLALNAATTDVALGTTTTFSDSFNTRNQFYGVNLGLRGSLQYDRLSVDVTGKVALGSTHEVVDIQGRSAQAGDPAVGAIPGTYPGGLFAQPSNIGRYSSNRFSVVPAVELKVGYQITPAIKAFVGYDYLYWNQVVRPGNQIDRNVNTSQSSVFTGVPGGTFAGPAQPAAIINRSDFWAQGVTFGVEFRY